MTLPSIFVSHSGHDNVWCSEFVSVLQQEGFDVWYDKTGNRAGESWVGVIEKELQARTIFLIVLSPDSWNSKWVRDELQLALICHRRIVPVQHISTQVDGFLLARQWVDVVGLSPLDSARRVVKELTESITYDEITGNVPVPPSLEKLGFVGRLSGATYFIVPPVCDVPEGEFTLGGDSRNSFPPQRLTLGSYSISKFPVTVAEYACAVKAGYVPEPPSYASVTWQIQLQREDFPVVCVSWKHAVDYAAWLATTAGQSWKLPTEAEWEKAARGTDDRKYAWGSLWDPRIANTNENEIQGLRPIGTFPADTSPFGVHDISGGVSEWCTTIYRPYPYNASDGRENLDPEGQRVVRGGSWDSARLYAEVSSRSGYDPTSCNFALGFRLAQSR